MAVTENTITKEVLSNARVRETEFTLMFEENIKKLLETLGVTRKVRKEAGAILKTYKASGTLESGKVAEGEVIPLSKYSIVPVSYKEIVLNKWAKSTTAEAIMDYGFDQAVTRTTDKMLFDIQAGIQKDFFTCMGTGTSAATGIGLQATLAQTWGKLQVLFENNNVSSTVYFINPLDLADYLAGKEITMQTAFGMNYVENFLGLGQVFVNSLVPKGKIYATAKDNIVFYYVPVNGADLGQAFDFTTDETGYVGIHEKADYSNMTCVDTVMSGIEMFPERIDGIVIGTITTGE